MSNPPKNKTGFTLIEMVVTIAIMALILSLTLANIRGRSQVQNLNLAEANLVSDLHKIQSYSIESENYSTSDPASSWNMLLVPSGTSYSITATDTTSTPEVSETVSSPVLPQNVSISTIQITQSNGTVVPASCVLIGFTVPYSRIVMTYNGSLCSSAQASGNQEENDQANITLTTTSGSTKTILVDGVAGNISTP